MTFFHLVSLFFFSSLGKAYSSSQRPRPSSPFSTDSNTSAAVNQGQRPRPTKKHKGGRLEQPPLPHRREGITDGECCRKTCCRQECPAGEGRAIFSGVWVTGNYCFGGVGVPGLPCEQCCSSSSVGLAWVCSRSLSPLLLWTCPQL